MGRLVRIPSSIWIKMTKEQKEEYYKQQKKENILVGIIVSVTLIMSFTLLLLWGWK
jgi:hypothetical protein